MRRKIEYAGENIFLRMLKYGDIENLRELRNRDENRSKFVYSDIITGEQQKRWYDNYLIKTDDYMFSVWLKTTGEWIGAVALYDINTQNGTAEFGRIVLDKKKIGSLKGLGVEVTKATCEIGFIELGIKQIHLEVFKDNVPALKTYERSGFRTIGQTKTEDGTEMYLMECTKELLS